MISQFRFKLPPWYTPGRLFFILGIWKNYTFDDKPQGATVKGYIYKITNPAGKIYIGKTTDPKSRFKFYRLGHCKRQTKLYRSILKYGWDNHPTEILDNATDSNELNRLEVFYIKKFNSFNSTQGLNLTAGGERCNFADETIEKLRANSTGRSPSTETRQKLRLANLGKKHSPETIAKRNIANKGKIRSQETRRRISEARKGMKFSEAHISALKAAKRPPITEAQKIKISNALKGRPATTIRVKGRPVINTVTGAEFVNMKLAAVSSGINYEALKSQLYGKVSNRTNLLLK